MNTFVKEIETDIGKLSVMSNEIDVRKENKRVQYITRCLIDTVKEKNLKGLAAPQIGYYVRMFAINFNGTVKVFINPGITNCVEQSFARETCSSLPGKTFIVPRYGKCDVMYMTPQGVPEFRTFNGVAAFVYQHYLDHLEGITLQDFALEIESDFDEADDETKQEILRRYAETIGIKLKEAKQAIEDDPEAKKFDNAVRFLSAKNRGEIEFDKPVEVKAAQKVEEEKVELEPAVVTPKKRGRKKKVELEPLTEVADE